MRNHPKQTLVLALFLLFVLFVPTQTHAGFFGWMKNVFSKDAENQTAQVIKTTRNRPVGMDGEARGHGKKFKVKDSHYADVVLESSTPITAEIKSIQNLIVIRTETADGQIVLSLSNLPKNTTYFKYIDSLRTAEEMKTDSAGFLTFNLNTSSPHIIFLQTKKSTRFINDDATGGNCTAIGIWTASTKTCNLNQDLTETIEIESDDITLDGNGHTLTGSNTGNGIFVNERTGVTIKNITVKDFSNGIYITGGSGTKVQNVNVADSVDAIEMESHSGGLIENSSLSGSSGSLLSGGRGIELDGAINTVIIKNIMNGNEVGLRLIITAGSVVTQNTLQNNTEAGLRLVASNGETIYQNNFISNANQVTTALSPTGTSFNEPWPKGGNFWNNHTPCTPRPDNSNLCQESYDIQSGFLLTTLTDNDPWVSQDKWVNFQPPTVPTCFNNILDGDEKGIDCGGSCSKLCASCTPLVLNGNVDNKIDIVFLRDNDYNDSIDDFIDDSIDVIDKSLKAKDVIENNINQFNFYYWSSGEANAIDENGPGAADDECILDIPKGYKKECSFADAGVILHTATSRDCARGEVFSSELTSFGTFLPEISHAVFDFAAEYCCDGGYYPPKIFPDIWNSLQKCEEHRITEGYSNSCEQICDPLTNQCINKWKLSGENLMSNSDLDSNNVIKFDFNEAHIKRINYVFNQYE